MPSPLPAQRLKQIADCCFLLGRMTKSEISVYAVAVASSFPPLGDIASLKQVSDYLPRSPLRNAYCVAQFAGGDARMQSQIA